MRPASKFSPDRSRSLRHLEARHECPGQQWPGLFRLMGRRLRVMPARVVVHRVVRPVPVYPWPVSTGFAFTIRDARVPADSCLAGRAMHPVAATNGEETSWCDRPHKWWRGGRHRPLRLPWCRTYARCAALTTIPCPDQGNVRRFDWRCGARPQAAARRPDRPLSVTRPGVRAPLGYAGVLPHRANERRQGAGLRNGAWQRPRTCHDCRRSGVTASGPLYSDRSRPSRFSQSASIASSSECVSCTPRSRAASSPSLQ